MGRGHLSLAGWRNCRETEPGSRFPIRNSFILGEAAGLALAQAPLTPWPGRAPRDSLPLACGLCLGPGLPEAEATPSRLRAKVVIFLLGSDPPSWLPPGLWGHSSADSVQLAQVTPGQFTLGPLLASQAVLWIACEC